MIMHFTKHEAIILNHLNQQKNSNLSINDRITKAKLSLKLQTIHAQHAKARLKRAQEIAPLLLGQKMIKTLGVKTFDDLLNNYFVIFKNSNDGKKFKAVINRNNGNQPPQK